MGASRGPLPRVAPTPRGKARTFSEGEETSAPLKKSFTSGRTGNGAGRTRTSCVSGELEAS